MSEATRIKETLRFDDNSYATVDEVVWCLDEEYPNDLTRVNIGASQSTKARQ